jgi:hypothetical protein
LRAVANSEHKMKTTRRPQRAFAPGQGQISARLAAGTTVQRSGNNQEHWQQRRQYYLHLAESAGNADRVDRENYWQHAEHFHRLIAEAAAARCQLGAGAAESVSAPAVH